jgi:hypothetical protein
LWRLAVLLADQYIAMRQESQEGNIVTSFVSPRLTSFT